ncbi:phage tail protein I [Pseudoalteromonas phenolica]|uniref:Phage tail protein I n=1 Tax=Pseudoalteromonas phenolica TaxID=161398 RepID=A0A5S3YYF1_9GAMM|nr:phage tail protein I [Pseudoalteromonas phenolica]TMP83758.1 phage tail protein I [Pseudoalteromonas phenolica]
MRTIDKKKHEIVKISQSIENTVINSVEQFSSSEVIEQNIAHQWDPLRCPVTLLPWLAWSLSVDDWDESWTEETKRAMIANSVKVHKHKGTVGAVKKALSALGLQIDFFEWFEDVDDVYLAPYHSREPNTFIFIAWANETPYTSKSIVLDQTLYDAIYRVTNQTKPQKAHFDFLVGVKMSSAMLAGAISKQSISKRSYAQVLPHAKTRYASNELWIFNGLSKYRMTAFRAYAISSGKKSVTFKNEMMHKFVCRKVIPNIFRQYTQTAKTRKLSLNSTQLKINLVQAKRSRLSVMRLYGEIN